MKKFLPKRVKRSKRKLSVNVQRSLWKTDVQLVKIRWQFYGSNTASASVPSETSFLYSNTPLNPGRGLATTYFGYNKPMPGANQWAVTYNSYCVLGCALKLEIVANNYTLAGNSAQSYSWLAAIMPAFDVNSASTTFAGDDAIPYANRKGCKWGILAAGTGGGRKLVFKDYMSNSKIAGETNSEWIANHNNWGTISNSSGWGNPNGQQTSGWVVSIQNSLLSASTLDANQWSMLGTLTYYVRLFNFGGNQIKGP